MDIPVIEIGTDIFEYITKNWCIPYTSLLHYAVLLLT